MTAEPATKPIVSSIFAEGEDGRARALLVAGACGNVGFGKLGQLARLLVKHDVPVVALDLAPEVETIADRLRDAYGSRFDEAEVDRILANVHVVRGTVADIPATLSIGMAFEAIPERLDIKQPFYRALRERDPSAYIFSATSGFPSTTLFDGLPGAQRCGVMHPFFPHLTNKLWEVPTRDAVTGSAELAVMRKLLSRLGMTVIEVADVPAFAADRIFCGMMLEAVRIQVDTGLSPAQVDDACRKTLGTSPFYVHNLITGADYLSAHCMELLGQENDSTLFAIPDAWRPMIEDPEAKWPYERGEKCPPDQIGNVRDRIYGMLFGLTAYMVEHEIADLDALNYLCENALAFGEGIPAAVERIGFDEARAVAERFLSEQNITMPERVAPLQALASDRPGWHRLYVDTSVHGNVGLISLKRRAINHTFIAELDRAYTLLDEDPGVQSIVIAPDGTYSREFGHGADLGCFVPVLGDHAKALELIVTWKRTLARLREGKPTVAALVGRVLGGGLELAAACHARIAAKGTRLAFPETTVGVIPGLGGCHHLHRFASAEAHARINEVLLTGHTVAVDEAAGWGFVSNIVDVRELPGASMKLASELGAGKVPLPSFRTGPTEVAVDRNVATTNEAGVALDSELRDLLVATIEETNALPWADASKLEEDRAATSLAMSSSKIGVSAMLRGKPPKFEHPLS